MLNVVGRKWRPLSAFSMHNPLIYSQKYVANALNVFRSGTRTYARTRKLPRLSDPLCLIRRVRARVRSPTRSFPLFLSADLHKSRKREGGAKSKVQPRRPAGINRGAYFCAFYDRRTARGFLSRRGDFQTRREVAASVERPENMRRVLWRIKSERFRFYSHRVRMGGRANGNNGRGRWYPRTTDVVSEEVKLAASVNRELIAIPSP